VPHARASTISHAARLSCLYFRSANTAPSSGSSATRCTSKSKATAASQSLTRPLSGSRSKALLVCSTRCSGQHSAHPSPKIGRVMACKRESQMLSNRLILPFALALPRYPISPGIASATSPVMTSSNGIHCALGRRHKKFPLIAQDGPMLIRCEVVYRPLSVKEFDIAVTLI
jgi:hypothetical protein